MMLKFSNFSLDVAHYRWLGRKTWHPLLSNISLEVQPGELVALVGGSGEGKSLLLQSVLGLIPDNMRCRGEIILDGKTLDTREKIEHRGKSVCYVPQGVSALNPLIKVGSQITRAAQLSGVELRLKDVALQLQTYNLAPGLIYDFPRQLSGGMAKRVLASCATLTHAQYILADEVTSWLDDEHACQLLTHLRAFCQQGRAILWVTHDLALAARFADKIAVLRQGEICETLQADELKNHGGSEWLQSLWDALPEQQFISQTISQREEAEHADYR